MSDCLFRPARTLPRFFLLTEASQFRCLIRNFSRANSLTILSLSTDRSALSPYFDCTRQSSSPYLLSILLLFRSCPGCLSGVIQPDILASHRKWPDNGIVHLPAQSGLTNLQGVDLSMSDQQGSKSTVSPGKVPSKPVLKLSAFLPYRLNHLAETVSRSFSRIYADTYGIGIPEWRVLATLGEYKAMTARDISQGNLHAQDQGQPGCRRPGKARPYLCATRTGTISGNRPCASLTRAMPCTKRLSLKLSPTARAWKTR